MPPLRSPTSRKYARRPRQSAHFHALWTCPSPRGNHLQVTGSRHGGIFYGCEPSSPWPNLGDDGRTPQPAPNQPATSRWPQAPKAAAFVFGGAEGCYFRVPNGTFYHLPTCSNKIVVQGRCCSPAVHCVLSTANCHKSHALGRWCWAGAPAGGNLSEAVFCPVDEDFD